MPQLVLGPLLRYVGETEAVIWVETSDACEVEVLGTRDRTFCVCDHHYAIVRCGGLEPGTWHEYEVLLDGERAHARAAKVEEELQVARDEIARLQGLLERSAEVVAAMKRSPSWRLTAPLRRLKRPFSR